MSEELEELEAQLSAFYGEEESDEKVERRKLLIREDGTVNGFQRTALAGQIRRKKMEEASAGQNAVASGVPATPIPEVGPEFAADVPEPVEGYEDRIDLVQEIKGRLTIQTTVANYGKPQGEIKWGSKTDGIHVRCPFPTHVDNNPSAWVNTTKHTWFCGACQVGGDQIDFYAASRHGFTPDQFHTKDRFRPILVELAESLGIDTEPTSPIPPDDDPPLAAPPIEPEPAPEPPAAPAVPPEPVPLPDEPAEPQTITVEQMTAGISPDSLDFDPRDAADPLAVTVLDPWYDWRSLDLPEGTFFHDWMTQNTQDYPWVPPEYFMMLGFQALGLACGNETMTITGMPLAPSMMVAIIGHSGIGKSVASRVLARMLDTVDPCVFNEETGTGVKQFETPASPEALVDIMITEVEDPQDPTRKIPWPTCGWHKEEEFASFVSKARRKGGEHMRQRVINLNDFVKTKNEPEIAAVDHSRTGGRRVVYDSFYMATFITQPDALRLQVEDVDMISGFFNRIIPVFGVQRARRKMQQKVDPNPGYYVSYQNTWNRCRRPGRKYILPAPETETWVDDSDYFEMLNERAKTPILARLDLHIHRMAFLLAVNEAADQVLIRHYETAIRLIEGFVLPCIAKMVDAAKASDIRDAMDEVYSYCKRYYASHDEWPTRSTLVKTRFWRNIPVQMQQIVEDGLKRNHQVMPVMLKNIKSGHVVEVMVVTEGDYAKYAESAYVGKTYDRESFYANA